ncbi:MAG: diguanylate cyclase [Cyanobium sp. PLM2.Bin73]|nr:MAG: diguanylate cyclase [Cyanobium sp. PLM2.Bin73]
MPSPSPALPPIRSENGRRLWTLLGAITGGSARFFTPDGADEPYRALVEQMGDGVGILSADGRLLYANPRLAELLDRPGETLLGRPLAELIPPSQRACLDRLHKVSPGRTERAELELLPDAGEPIRVLAAVSGLEGAGIGTHCVIFTDLSGLRSPPGMAPASDEHRRLRWMRFLSRPLKGDGLSCSWSEVVSHTAAQTLQRLPQPTGLVSRSELLEQLWRHHPPSHRRSQPLALALCYVRNLRTIHQDQGVETADRVVQTIEERVRRVLPNNTILARVNVDQLLVVLGCMNNHAQAEATAESIRAVLALPLPNQGALIRITAWVDVTLEQPGECVEDLISSALQQSRGRDLARDTVG